MASTGLLVLDPPTAGYRFVVDTPLDVLVLAKSGVGHYQPVAALVAALAPADRVGIAAHLQADHPVRGRVASDGFRFVEWPLVGVPRLTSAVLRAMRRRLVRSVAPRIAGRTRSGAALPPLTSRAVFAGASLLRSDEGAHLAFGQNVAELVRSHKPRLILSEETSPWVGIVSAESGIPWAHYVTGPVGVPRRRGAIEPGGFPANPTGAERWVNELLRSGRACRDWRSGLVAGRGRRSLGFPAAQQPIASFAFASPSLDDPARRQEGWRYVGLSPRNPPHDWRDTPPGPGERDTVFVTLGSGSVWAEAGLLASLVPALKRLSATHRVVVQTGNPLIRDAFDEVGTRPGVELLDPSDGPPYAEYRRARVVISHGGYGTINESIAFGSPVLLLAELRADRMETSRRVMEANVGKSLNRYALSPAGIVAAVEEIASSPVIADQVSSIGRDLRDEHPVRELRGLLAAHLELVR